MAILSFGRSKPVVFESYGRRRSRARLPRWLLLLLAGTVAGAGAVVVVQQRYLPPRLSASASAALRDEFAQADAERQRLRADLGQAQARLQSALSDQQALAEEMGSSRAVAARQREDLASAIAALPPDPRGGAVAVRAGRFSTQAGLLHYDIVLTRERATGKPLTGTLLLLVAGASEGGAPTTVSAKPVTLSVGSHEVVRGTLPLPQGFKPRQTTVQVLDAAAGKPLGMRILSVP